MPARIAVVGEALIDLAETGDDAHPLAARPGGSPYNVAIALARLGQHAVFVGRLSTDPLGLVLRRHARRSGVDLTAVRTTSRPSTLALVELDSGGSARYQFGVDGTADFAWTDDELAPAPDELAAVHFGSLASWLAPGEAAVRARVQRWRSAGALISYDPNVRPQLQHDVRTARRGVEAGVGLAQLVKCSVADLRWLYPREPIADVAASWRALGSEVVIVTDGAAGASAYLPGSVVHRRSPAVDVVDTVGAGDAFTAGMLDALNRQGRLEPAGLAQVRWAAALDAAALVAAITCSRAGANPPWRDELDSRPPDSTTRSAHQR